MKVTVYSAHARGSSTSLAWTSEWTGQFPDGARLTLLSGSRRLVSSAGGAQLTVDSGRSWRPVTGFPGPVNRVSVTADGMVAAALRRRYCLS